jgi:hypothetical protein
MFEGCLMIVSNRQYMFGTGQVGVVHNENFRCAVSTAPEGLFKKYSTVILTFDGEWGANQNKQVVAKAMLRPGLSSGQRAEIHGAVLTHLDVLGSKGTGLADAIDEAFSAAKGKNLIVDSLNQAHFLVAAEHFNRKRSFDAEAKVTLIDGVSAMLLALHMTTGTRSIEDDSGNVNRPALGYIFGFVQAGIANLGGDPLDAFVGAPVMLDILKRVYPGRERRYLDFVMENLETDTAMNDGARYGGQQYLDYIVHNHPSGGQPAGFAGCLLGEAVPTGQQAADDRRLVQ